MLSKIIVLLIFINIITAFSAFIAFRFGFFGPKQVSVAPITQLSPDLKSTLIASESASPSQTKSSTPSASIKILKAPKEATGGAPFVITWFIDNPKVATISHTAAHYGPIARPNAKFPSDYPEKSAIFKGTIPATFSAQLSIFLPGTYYTRTHAIVENKHIWSDEKTLTIKNAATPSATPTPR